MLFRSLMSKTLVHWLSMKFLPYGETYGKPTGNLQQCGFLITFPDWDPTLITKCLPNVRHCRHFKESCVDLSLISRRLEPASHRILSGNPSPSCPVSTAHRLVVISYGKPTAKPTANLLLQMRNFAYIDFLQQNLRQKIGRAHV